MARRSAVLAALPLALGLLMGAAHAQEPHRAPPGLPAPSPRGLPAPSPHGFPPPSPHGLPPHGGPATAHPQNGHEGAAPHATGHAAHDESAPPEAINWYHGLLGAKEGVEPSLLWRSPEEPPPFLASVINFGLLVLIAVVYGRKPLAAALTKRKETILREMEEAKHLREQAEKRLAEYEAKLAKINEELENIRREFRDQGERDKQRIVSEAQERRERMRKDADFLLGQELKQLRQDLIAQTVDEATRLAADLISKRLTQTDQEKFAETFLTQLRADTERGGSAITGYEAVAKGGAS